MASHASKTPKGNWWLDAASITNLHRSVLLALNIQFSPKSYINMLTQGKPVWLGQTQMAVGCKDTPHTWKESDVRLRKINDMKSAVWYVRRKRIWHHGHILGCSISKCTLYTYTHIYQKRKCFSTFKETKRQTLIWERTIVPSLLSEGCSNGLKLILCLLRKQKDRKWLDACSNWVTTIVTRFAKYKF